MNIKKNKAFSLVELSITILIIGILVAAIVKGKTLYKDIKIAAARSMTTSSIVSSMKNLEAWYEISSDKSFNENETFEDSNVSIWYDLNPTSTNKNNLITQSINNVPSYKENCINYLPCLNFESSNKERLIGQRQVNISGSSAQGTIFIVGIATSSTAPKYPLTISGGTTLEVLRLDTNTSASEAGFRFQGANRLYKSPFKDKIPFVSTWTFSQSNRVNYYDLYVNGKIQTQNSTAGSSSTINLKNISLVVGGENYGGTYQSFYDGQISEIIIFDRYLSSKERESVEKYLGQKYSIKITH